MFRMFKTEAEKFLPKAFRPSSSVTDRAEDLVIDAYNCLAKKKRMFFVHNLFAEQSDFCYRCPTIKEKVKSIESLFCLEESFEDARVYYSFYHPAERQVKYTILSSVKWPEYIKSLDEKISITIGYRKAFSTNIQTAFSHAVILVKDSSHRAAIYGYNRFGNDHSILIQNDISRENISRNYTFYESLTINGNKTQVENLFLDIETRAKKMIFTGLTSNCYTLLIAGLLNAKMIGFELPEDYKKRLLVVISVEQNFGIGIRTNKELGPLVDKAVIDIRASP